MKLIDITGQRFGKLVALKYIGNKTWLFQCDCGNTKVVWKGSVLCGDTKSCGCLWRVRRFTGVEIRQREKLSRDKRRAASKRVRNQYVWDYLKAHPCVDCGESDPIVLEFDHRDPKTKQYSVADLNSARSYSLSTLIAEISKCDVRCANCHRRRHSRRKACRMGIA